MSHWTFLPFKAPKTYLNKTTWGGRITLTTSNIRQKKIHTYYSTCTLLCCYESHHYVLSLRHFCSISLSTTPLVGTVCMLNLLLYSICLLLFFIYLHLFLSLCCCTPEFPLWGSINFYLILFCSYEQLLHFLWALHCGATEHISNLLPLFNSERFIFKTYLELVRSVALRNSFSPASPPQNDRTAAASCETETTPTWLPKSQKQLMHISFFFYWKMQEVGRG